MKKSFTLLELLVVIGIIGLLVGLGSVSYSTAQRKARDAKRKDDLRTIQNAMEQYYSVCGFNYPTPAAGNDTTVVPQPIACADPATTLLTVIPTDPKSKFSYTMTQSTNMDYSICAPNTPPLETEATTPYCLSNQQ